MLKSLHIKDYALIDKIDVDFDKGLNIITGETGAGKSILIDAMSLLLGERAFTEVVRKDAQKAIVEGVFVLNENKDVNCLLLENEIEILPELIIRREISLKGNNRCFVNDTPVSLGLIKDLGNLLVDLHGQHDHQSLLRVETHLTYLDKYGNYDSVISDYREKYNQLIKLINKYNSVKESENLLKEKKEIYSFQLKEIDSVSPLENEDDNISDELKVLESSEKLLELTSNIYQSLYEDSDSVVDRLSKIKSMLIELKNIDGKFSESVSECETALTLINDISEFVRNYNSKIDIDPETVEQKRERLGSLNLLKRKYGGTLKAVLQHREKIAAEIELAENFDDKLASLQSDINNLKNQCADAALKLSQLRKQAAKKIESEVVKTLSLLGIDNSVFKISISNLPCENSGFDYLVVNNKKYLFNSNGIDEVEFFISTNLGEDPKPLIKVASGGEISRIMLALKTILANKDKLPLLIFDEIDTGISGRIAKKVGESIKALSKYHQIIAITHLPQIGALADQHYSVHKFEVDKRIVSKIKRLNEEERINELAKLMSGEVVTEASIQGAKDLMNN